MQVVIFITFRYNRDDRRLSHMKFLYQTFTDYNLEEFTRFNMIVPLRISDTAQRSWLYATSL